MFWQYCGSVGYMVLLYTQMQINFPVVQLLEHWVEIVNVSGSKLVRVTKFLSAIFGIFFEDDCCLEGLTDSLFPSH